MRPLVVLLIIAAALIALSFKHDREEKSFDRRFENAQERIRSLGNDIDDDLDARQDIESR